MIILKPEGLRFIFSLSLLYIKGTCFTLAFASTKLTFIVCNFRYRLPCSFRSFVSFRYSLTLLFLSFPDYFFKELKSDLLFFVSLTFREREVNISLLFILCQQLFYLFLKIFQKIFIFLKLPFLLQFLQLVLRLSFLQAL